jgi:hypothetical protein
MITPGKPTRKLTPEERRAALEDLERPERRKQIIWQVAIFFVVLGLWQVPIINPVKLLVVLFHEMSHVFAAYATGGVVFGMAIDPGGAGVTLGMEGNELLIVAAGYVGSLFAGMFLYYLSAVWKPWEVWLVLALMCSASLLMGWLNDFTAVFGWGAMIAMFFGLMLPEEWKKFFLRVVATACCLYAIIDVTGVVFGGRADGFSVRGKVVGSDVARLAELTGLPEGLLVTIWVIVGVTAAVAMIGWAADRDAKDIVKKSLMRKKEAKTPEFEYKRYDPSDPNSIPEYTIR